MARYEVLNPLDYRPKGDTIDGFAVKFIQEINKIYSHLNALRENREDDEYPTEPAAGQIRIRDGKLYVRDEENVNWVELGTVSYLMGVLQDMNDRVLTEVDIATAAHEAGKLPTFNDNNIIDGDITGSPARIRDILIEPDTQPQDGDVLVYRPSDGKFIFEPKLIRSEYDALVENARQVVTDLSERAKVELGLLISSYGDLQLWGANTTYQPGETVIMPDGSVYRALETVTGEQPGYSNKWTIISLPTVWAIDEEGDIMPFNGTNGTIPLVATFEEDEFGDLMPRKTVLSI